MWKKALVNARLRARRAVHPEVIRRPSYARVLCLGAAGAVRCPRSDSPQGRGQAARCPPAWHFQSAPRRAAQLATPRLHH
ncbi:hypothetical protein EVAR_62751_1 [Eumeta japonica]|uniref:Uncharacterized protein n=1 Tax=Eumeta variegata TaxID=151549 RepID=A0A4C1ZBA4_EUMVA|nr:hypothetical protein EVAR_62751_1 [Eumeta japonica]